MRVNEEICMPASTFKKRILFIGIPDMAFVCLDGLKIAGINIVGVMGAKKDHPTYSDFKKFVKLRELNFIEYDELDDERLIKQVQDLNKIGRASCRQRV